jgi:hypothetical protein
MAVAEAPRPRLSSRAVSPTAPSLRALLLTSPNQEIDGWRIKLEDDGYDVVETGDVETALGRLLAAAPPDIAILDGVHAADATDRLLGRLRGGRAPLRTAILVSKVQRASTPGGGAMGAEHRLELLEPA